jgi:hypothetical protein
MARSNCYAMVSAYAKPSLFGNDKEILSQLSGFEAEVTRGRFFCYSD